MSVADGHGLVGIGYRPELTPALELAAPAERPELLELVADHFFADPERAEALADRTPVVIHDLGLSVGTRGGSASAAGRDQLARLRDLVQRTRPVVVSTHLAVTRSSCGVALGHLAPLWNTRRTLACVEGEVKAVQDSLGRAIALENIAAPFVVPGADLSEPELLFELCERTGCGLLLDVSNLLQNARNFGFDAARWLREHPVHAVLQVHLAGGAEEHGFFVDSHATGVEKASFALLEELARHLPGSPPIIVERDRGLPPLAELLREAAHARSVWQKAQRDAA